jgi:hypothetical protein
MMGSCEHVLAAPLHPYHKTPNMAIQNDYIRGIPPENSHPQPGGSYYAMKRYGHLRDMKQKYNMYIIIILIHQNDASENFFLGTNNQGWKWSHPLPQKKSKRNDKKR